MVGRKQPSALPIPAPYGLLSNVQLRSHIAADEVTLIGLEDKLQRGTLTAKEVRDIIRMLRRSNAIVHSLLS